MRRVKGLHALAGLLRSRPKSCYNELQRTLDSVLLPLPFLPMMACTSPAFTVRVTPLRISCPVAAIVALVE